MAKVVIVLEDIGNNVRVTCDPSFETMAMMDKSGHQLTSAHGYAFAAIKAVRKAAKAQQGLTVDIPRIIRPG